MSAELEPIPISRVSTGHVQLFSRTVGAAVRWRLLSGNNRETGRGAQSFPDAETCRLAVKEIQTMLDDLTGQVRRTQHNDWGWQLLQDGQPIAVSGRGFGRLIRCEQGLAQFRVQLRDADIGPALMVSHARRW